MTEKTVARACIINPNLTHLKGVLAGSKSPLYLRMAGPLRPVMLLPLVSERKSGGGLANKSSLRTHACCHCSKSLRIECKMAVATGSSEDRERVGIEIIIEY